MSAGYQDDARNHPARGHSVAAALRPRLNLTHVCAGSRTAEIGISVTTMAGYDGGAEKQPGRPVQGAALVAPDRRLRPLDGIRALAVAAVLATHAGIPFLPGGFIGVDVFFVLSGFLITSLLYDELVVTGRIDLGGFWTRRARRLLPAALVMIVAVRRARCSFRIRSPGCAGTR